MTASFVPLPGIYVSDTIVYLQSRTKNDISIGGSIVADPSINALINLLAVTAVSEATLFGGSLAVNVNLPFAWAKMDFSGRFLGGSAAPSLHDKQNGMGDLSITPIIGWHDGIWNYSASVTFYLPTGEYSTAVVKPRQGIYDVLSISKNKFAVDPTFSATWLNPDTGIEVNGAIGVTISAINSATDYQTAPELHVETAIGKHFANGFVLGLAGYGYHQLANDSGSGAKSFQAAVNAKSLQASVFGAGPIVGYTTKIGNVGVNLQGKYFHEFAAKRRLKSDAFWLNASFSF